jgi:hypothetical protein
VIAFDILFNYFTTFFLVLLLYYYTLFLLCKKILNRNRKRWMFININIMTSMSPPPPPRKLGFSNHLMDRFYFIRLSRFYILYLHIIRRNLLTVQYTFCVSNQWWILTWNALTLRNKNFYLIWTQKYPCVWIQNLIFKY